MPNDSIVIAGMNCQNAVEGKAAFIPSGAYGSNLEMILAGYWSGVEQSNTDFMLKHYQSNFNINPINTSVDLPLIQPIKSCTCIYGYCALHDK